MPCRVLEGASKDLTGASGTCEPLLFGGSLQLSCLANCTPSNNRHVQTGNRHFRVLCGRPPQPQERQGPHRSRWAASTSLSASALITCEGLPVKVAESWTGHWRGGAQTPSQLLRPGEPKVLALSRSLHTQVPSISFLTNCELLYRFWA